MTYTELIDYIFKWCELKGLSPSARICILSLFHYWRVNGCPKSFKMPLRSLYGRTGLSHATVLRSIGKLEQAKVIEVKKGGPRVPNTYKVMVHFMVHQCTISGVMVHGYTKTVIPLYNTTTIPNNIPTPKEKEKEKGRDVQYIDKRTITAEQLADPKKPKRLSMWLLKNQKESCETELKALSDNGYEDAMGHRWANKADRSRAKELKKKIMVIVMKMQEANT